MKVKIHREGTNILVILFMMLAIVNVPVWMFIRPLVFPIVFSSLSLITFLLTLNFFRSPHRNFTGNRKNVVVSSVDGTVVALERTYENEYLHREAIQISEIGRAHV